ncbi:GOLPH3/VPS74 family protein [Saccharopolyspora sp. MS10]|uniref:GOLPH3/VPS74 family protein n=1 Tax=Saccharopolyspora sp. MS10 TaxID=3385973 RepID=UPI0039A0F56A
MTRTLPQQLFLLSYNTDKGALESSSALVRGQLLRAAAVAELRLSGHLADHGGKAVRVPGAPEPSDPFLAEVLSVADERPRRWLTVVDHRWHKAEAAVRDHFAATGAIDVERRRKLGVFPSLHVELAAPEEAHALRTRLRNLALEGGDLTAAPIEDVALIAIAAEGDVAHAFAWRERRRAKAAFRAVTDRFDAEFPRLRGALQMSIAARRTAATG